MANETLGSMVDKLQELRAGERDLEAQIKIIKEQRDKIEESLIARMDKEGVDKMTGSKATASITTRELPKIEDEAKFFAFVKRTGNFFLFERRISSVAYRDTVDSRDGKPIPGLEVFKSRKISLRDLL